jgi:hypothetical protein
MLTSYREVAAAKGKKKKWWQVWTKRQQNHRSYEKSGR